MVKNLSNQAISSVTAAEAQAEELVQLARNTAREKLAAAREQAVRGADDAVRAESALQQKALEEALVRGRNEGEALRSETQKRCEALRAEAERNMDAAVKLIVERVVKN